MFPKEFWANQVRASFHLSGITMSDTNFKKMLEIEEWQTEMISGENPDVFKFIFKKSDAIAEAVLYKYPTFEDRTVMCISTQSGCPMGCTFCGTGKFFARNLTGLEIVEQVFEMLNKFDLDFNKIKKSQIMFMSMGEPLLNFEGLKEAVEILHLHFPETALLVSSSGPDTLAISKFMELAKEVPTLGLQFSIHESLDEKRDLLIPMKAKLNLKQISRVGDSFHQLTGRSPFFNYCVHPGNSSDEDVERLVELFNPEVWSATLSVICEKDETLKDATDRHLELVQDFASRLVSKGFNTRVFNPAGQDDIGGGCGQLWQVQKFAEENPDIMKKSPGAKCAERANSEGV